MLTKREVVHLHGIPIGTVSVTISDGGMIIVGGLEVTTSQVNLALATDQMTFVEEPTG